MTAFSQTQEEGSTAAAGQRQPLPEWLIWCGIAILLAIRIALSLHNLGAPGLDMDETLFVNASTLRIPGVYIPHQIDGIPLMVFPYIGALKAWIYTPIFSVFGGSVDDRR